MTPRAVIVGPPGAGKTTVGSAVAEMLRVPFRDTDEDIARQAGISVADIFVVHGEPHFRALERTAVAAALDQHPGMVALGGGSVLDEGTRRLLVASGAPVVLLEVGVADAAARVGFNRDRPLLLGNPRQQWQRLLAARLPLYLEVSDIRVSTDGRTPAEIAAEVVDRLAAWEESR